MLKTHAAPDTTLPTTQEIAQAIASLEARSASHADQAAQTVTVSEVIQHLGLDMTPEDVLAEVQAQRARQAKTRTPWPLRKKRIAGILAGGALAIVWALGELLTPQYDSSLPPPLPAAAPASFFPMPKPLGIAPNLLVQDTVGHSSVLKTLAEIPDNHPVQCGITDTGIATTSGPLWTLVKHNGAVYLRCWTVPMSERALRQVSTDRGLTLFPTRSGAESGISATEPLTLALTNITLPTGTITDSASSLDALNVSLDSHAHETWNP